MRHHAMLPRMPALVGDPKPCGCSRWQRQEWWHGLEDLMWRHQGEQVTRVRQPSEP